MELMDHPVVDRGFVWITYHAVCPLQSSVKDSIAEDEALMLKTTTCHMLSHFLGKIFSMIDYDSVYFNLRVVVIKSLACSMGLSFLPRAEG